MTVTAIDLGFGFTKGIRQGGQVAFPSAVGSFRPVRFTSGLENTDLIDRLCVEFEGKRYFIGNIAYKQAAPRATMSADRFTSNEGLALLMSALLLLSNNQGEAIKLVAGLPVSEYARLKQSYTETLQGNHYIQQIGPDGSAGAFYRFDIEGLKLLPQAAAVAFDMVLTNTGDIADKQLAAGRLAVLDIGRYTVDMALLDGLAFIDKSSLSYSDLGLFDAYREISLQLKETGIDIPADSIEPYITGGKTLPGFGAIREQAFASLAEKICSRVYSAWPDLFTFDKIYIAGGGALALGQYIKDGLQTEKLELCNDPVMANCRGYYKFGCRSWR